LRDVCLAHQVAGSIFEWYCIKNPIMILIVFIVVVIAAVVLGFIAVKKKDQ